MPPKRRRIQAVEFDKQEFNRKLVIGTIIVAGAALAWGWSSEVIFGAKDNSMAAGVVMAVVAVIVAFFIGMLASIGEKGPPALEKLHQGGSKLVKVNELETGDGDITIGNVVVPADKELYHFAIEGAPGSGKTQTIYQIIHAARERGDTLVVLDSNDEIRKQFGREGDIVLSPFADGGVGWSPINEIHSAADWGSIFKSFISEGYGEARSWNAMARKFATTTSHRYYNECIAAGRKFDVKELFKLLTAATPDQIAMLVEDTSSAPLATSEKLLTNVRTSLIEGMASWEFLKPGSFSFRDWIDMETRPTIWIPYRKRNLEVMSHLMSAWLDQIILSAIDAGKSEKKTWLIIDELGNLGEIGGLVNSTTEVRKPGFRVVAALQNREQIEETYGENRSKTMLSNLANKVFFRVGSGEVAEKMSKDLGDQRVLTINRNYDGKGGQGYQEKDEVERVVIASEITSLPNLTAFVKLAESAEIKKTTIELYDNWRGKYDEWKRLRRKR